MKFIDIVPPLPPLIVSFYTQTSPHIIGEDTVNMMPNEPVMSDKSSPLDNVETTPETYPTVDDVMLSR